MKSTRIAQAPLLAIGSLAILALIGIVFVDVVARNLFNQPVPAALELSLYWMMVPMVFVGIWWSGVVRDHVRVSLLTERLGLSSNKLAEAIATLVSVTFLVVLVLVGFSEAIERMNQNEFIGSYRTPVWPMRFFVPLGLAAYAGVLVGQLVTHVRNQGERTGEDLTEQAGAV